MNQSQVDRDDESETYITDTPDFTEISNRNKNSGLLKKLVLGIVSATTLYFSPISKAGEIYNETAKIDLYGTMDTNVMTALPLRREININVNQESDKIILEYRLQLPKDESKDPLHLKTHLSNQTATVYVGHPPEVVVGNSNQTIYSEKTSGPSEIELTQTTPGATTELKAERWVVDWALSKSKVPLAKKLFGEFVDWYADKVQKSKEDAAKEIDLSWGVTEVPLYGTARFSDAPEKTSGVEFGRKIEIPVHTWEPPSQAVIFVKLESERSDRKGTLFRSIPFSMGENLEKKVKSGNIEIFSAPNKAGDYSSPDATWNSRRLAYQEGDIFGLARGLNEENRREFEAMLERVKQSGGIEEIKGLTKRTGQRMEETILEKKEISRTEVIFTVKQKIYETSEKRKKAAEKTCEFRFTLEGKEWKVDAL